ncbi:MAG: glycosyltransferase [Flavobacteriales bacterium]|nr:glycosyltransferase [Flavobacteriales bacterium]
MNERLQVLFLANRIPFPPYRGDKLKIYNLAVRLSRRHDLHLIAFVQNRKELKYRKDLEPYFRSIQLIHLPVWRSWLNSALNFLGSEPFQVAYFRSRAMHRAVRSFVNGQHVDVAHVQHMRMAQYFRNVRSVPRILDLPDAFSLYWERRNQVPRAWYNRVFDALEAKRVRSYERITSVFELNLACSIEDLEHLKAAHPNAAFALLRNGVDLEVFKFKGHDYSRNSTLLFTGNMDYAPNVDAVTYFVSELFGKLRAEFPGLRLVIAGQRPVKRVLELAGESIDVTGFVPDISELYATADIVIAPLRFGAGTQNKVLEAMAMGVPVVCTHIGFAGLEINSGEGVFMAENSAEFIGHIRNLLQSESLRMQTGNIGLKLAEERFSWDIVSRQLEAYLRETAQNAEKNADS